MSASLNRVMLIGNLGAKPELKFLPSGQAVCEMRIATNEAWKDKAGDKQEKVEWHRVKVWGKTAEHCAQYLDKGRAVYLEGRLETRSWDDKNTGEKRYATEIVADRVQFLGGKGGDEKAPRRSEDTKPGKARAATDPVDIPCGPPGGGEEDIPF